MASPSPALLELMAKVVDGDASYDELLQRMGAAAQSLTSGSDSLPAAIASPQVSPDAVSPDAVSCVDGATVDLGRQARCGFGEVVFGEGKSAELVTRIAKSQLAAGQSALITRIDSGVAFQVRHSFEYAYHNPQARTLRLTLSDDPPPQPLSLDEAVSTHHAAVVTAGSTDAAIAEEAIETLHWMRVPVQRFDDIGVAGPQRLAAAVPRLRLASAVVVVAGMEGALPATAAGHLAAPIFAVPTSVGYGASLGGLTALLGMLSSCAASVAVVNIDAGFKGGYLAGMVVRQLQQCRQQAARRESVE